MTGTAIALVLAAISAAVVLGLGGRRWRRRALRARAGLRPGLRHLAAQVGALSDFRLELLQSSPRHGTRRQPSLTAVR